MEPKRLILKNYCEKDLDNVYKLKSNPLVWEFSSKVVTDDIEESRRYLVGVLKNYTEDKYDFQALYIRDTKEYIREADMIETTSVDGNFELDVFARRILRIY